MENKHRVEITTRDLVMRAWQNSMELTRDFEIYSKEIHDAPEVAQTFARFAEEEGLHAAKLKAFLHAYTQNDAYRS